MNNKLIIVGLDGVSYELIRILSESGCMSETGKIIGSGKFKKINSSVPEVSSVAWTSIITGANPAEHGVYGFTDVRGTPDDIYFPNYNDVKRKSFWEQEEAKSIILNVPATYPVRPMNGVHISGFVSPDIRKSVYPKDLCEELVKMDYRLDADCEKAHESMELFLADADETLESFTKTCGMIIEKYEWDVFMPVFTTTDRIMHFLFDACVDKTHKFHNRVMGHFERIDRAIGEIFGKIGPRDNFFMLSDHGFEELELNLYVNTVLKDNGFLDSQKAFALDPGRIYINSKKRFRNGMLAEDEAEKTINEITDLFLNLEINGKKTIQSVFKKNEVYQGPLLNIAPDLVLLGSKGINLSASRSKKAVYDKPLFSGKHTKDNAFLIARREYPGALSADICSVEDAGRAFMKICEER